MTGTEDRSARADFPEFYRKLDRWIPTTSDESAVPAGAILTGSELTLTFDRPEFDATVSLGYMEARDSGIAGDPEDETIVQRLEHWARPEYVEGYRDAQGVVLGLIQAWEDPEQQIDVSDARVLAALRSWYGFESDWNAKAFNDMRAALRAADLVQPKEGNDA